MNDPSIEIWIDGQKQSLGNWSGRLSEGRYVIESRRKNHTTRSHELIVENGRNVEMNLDSPIPIEGQLNITSSPMEAIVYVDGQEVGMTPLLLPNLLIGEHTIEIRKESYNTEQRQITIYEGKLLEEDFTLNTVFTLNISSNYSGLAEIFVNGESKGLSPVSFETTAGEYIIEGKFSKYFAKEVLSLNPQNNHVELKLKEPPYPYFPKNGFYLEGGFTAGSLFGYGGAVGGYIAGINIEVFALDIKNDFDPIYTFNTNTYTTYQYLLCPNWKVGASLGYGFKLGKRFRVTPQLSLASIVGDCIIDNYSTRKEKVSLDCWQILPGVRCELGLYKVMTLVAKTSYAVKMQANPAIDQYSHLGLMDFSEGLSASLGLSLNF